MIWKHKVCWTNGADNKIITTLCVLHISQSEHKDYKGAKNKKGRKLNEKARWNFQSQLRSPYCYEHLPHHMHHYARVQYYLIYFWSLLLSVLLIIAPFSSHSRVLMSKEKCAFFSSVGESVNLTVMHFILPFTHILILNSRLKQP